jgi:hypothetical protein
MEKGFLKAILRSNLTVFSFKDLLLLWGGIDIPTARKRVNYYVKTGELYAIRRGIYGRDKNYNRLEMATKIFTPAYISFETVLGSAGITFQYYNQIFVATYQSLDRIADGQKIVFERLKSSILTNSLGIENRQNYSIASPERAFLDRIYRTHDYHFDNLLPINWEKVFEILPAYKPTRGMTERVKEYQESAEEQKS